MTRSATYLYDLLPAVYRMRDAQRGGPLKALLEIIGEQAVILEEDLDQLYDNLFIETAEDWAVPYLGDLLGYRPVHEAGEPGDPRNPAGRDRNRVLIPRREVAHTIDYRSRKGTLALLEVLSTDVADWPARAVEFFTLLGWTQHLNHQHSLRGRTTDVRDGAGLDLIDGPFDALAHSVDVRRPTSHRSAGRHDIPSIGVFVARLSSYSVTSAPACCIEKEGGQCYTFSVLGNNAPLFVRPERASDESTISGPLNLPLPIRRRQFAEVVSKRPYRAVASGAYYGDGRSLSIAVQRGRSKQMVPVPADMVIPADLTDWHAYQAPRGSVLVDPALGRMVFPVGQPPRMVDVTYHYGFSADMGGGEYHRQLHNPDGARVYRVRQIGTLDGEFATIREAYDTWIAERQVPTAEGEEPPRAAVIEIMDSRAYEEPLNFDLSAGESLQLRAADRRRPVLRLLDYRVNQPDPFSVRGEAGSRFVLDGMLVAGRGIAVTAPSSDDSVVDIGDEGDGPAPAGTDLCDVRIRHCTLVPGWDLGGECEPERPDEPSLTVEGTCADIVIEHSILGSIWIDDSELRSNATRVCITDSIVDATEDHGLALCDSGERIANAVVTVIRSTVVGETRVHAVALAENSIFTGPLIVARRQRGCVRFCVLPVESRAPGRYHCVPDVTGMAPVAADREALRVRPVFTSRRYGNPGYLQLGPGCAEEIRRGADDESELGAFHDLYQPQRLANLRARLDEYTVAGFETGIIDTNQGLK